MEREREGAEGTSAIREEEGGKRMKSMQHVRASQRTAMTSSGNKNGQRSRRQGRWRQRCDSRRSRRSVVVEARKVAVLGAAGGIGQPLSLLLTMNPLVRIKRIHE